MTLVDQKGRPIAAPTDDTGKQILFSRALALLGAVGYPYLIQKPDGTFVGELKLEPERIGRVNYKATGYAERIKKMRKGDAVTLDAPTHGTAAGFYETVSVWVKTHMPGCAYEYVLDKESQPQTLTVILVSPEASV